MAITAALVKELREMSGAGMMDAKKALTETDGDMEAAIDWLRTKGLAKAAKKAGRTAAEGLVAVAVDRYLHPFHHGSSENGYNTCLSFWILPWPINIGKTKNFKIYSGR